jgi:hypothetical protein
VAHRDGVRIDPIQAIGQVAAVTDGLSAYRVKLYAVAAVRRARAIGRRTDRDDQRRVEIAARAWRTGIVTG